METDIIWMIPNMANHEIIITTHILKMFKESNYE